MFGVLAAGIFLACEQDASGPAVRPVATTVLSTNGSTRATAYIMSNKIISADSSIFVAWLDRMAEVKIRRYDMRAEAWEETVHLGTGVDNHSGPALTMDSRGYLYAAFGPHHGPFQFRRTLQPYDIRAWSPVDSFGVNGTYPSLVCDAGDTLHCTYRGGPAPWRLMYQKKPPGGAWRAPVALLDPAVPDGYTQYDNPLMVAPDGTLHLGFHIYDMHPEGGKAIGYLRSRDGGKTWENAAGEKMALPVTPQSPCFIEQGDSLDMRFGNLAIDAQEHPWLAAFHNETSPRTAVLWHNDGRAWRARDLLPVVQAHFPDREITYSSLSFDSDGVLYLVSNIQKVGAASHWGDASLEIVLLTSADGGATFAVQAISEHDPQNPNWLPSIERPYGPWRIGVPSFLYTHGGPGEGLTGGPATEVVFVRLEKSR